MKSRVIIVTALLALGLGPAAYGEDQADAGRTMIVFDGSGSMWGRVEGRTKIEIARDSLGELLDDWQPGGGIGLMAYGHRRKGDCSDIETLVSPDNTDRDAARDAAAAINPKGKTPLSEAVRRAAKDLRHVEERASVILLSDGRETCGADPCEVGSQLERTGVDFTAHVIGFDVEKTDQQGLRCLAENTGGRFFAADEADELSAALDKAAREVSESQETTITLEATEGRGGPTLRADSLQWTVTDTEAGEPLIENRRAARPELSPEPGRYEARVEAAGGSGNKEFRVKEGEAAVHEVAVQRDASIQAPPRVSATGNVEVTWEGPAGERDYLTIVAADAPDGRYTGYHLVSNGNPLALRAPVEAGSYEIRYQTGDNDVVLARHELKVTPASVSLNAPDTVQAGAQFETEWQGPNHSSDYITVVHPDAEAGAYNAYTDTASGSPLRLRAPDKPGDYELRYVTETRGGEDYNLATRPIEVAKAVASLDAPERADAGSVVRVAWEGPDNKDDHVVLVTDDAPADEWGNYAYTKDGNPAEVRAPDEPGRYELRYVTGQANEILARRAIEVAKTDAQLQAPEKVGAGSEISVQWQGPANKDDHITLVPPDAASDEWGNYAYTKDSNPAKVAAPDTPGAYELRYVTGQDNKVLAERAIKVVAVDASLEAPAEVGAGSAVRVDWSGPANNDDHIVLVANDAPADEWGNYAYTKDGNPAEVRAPDEPGRYELRYVTGQSNKIITRRALQVSEVDASLRAPDGVAAGDSLQVEWEGPDNKDDHIVLVAEGAPPDEWGNYAYTSDGSPAKLEAPEKAGDYELRYVTGQSNRILARSPLKVTESR